MSVFQKYDHNFMAASLDEAYLDITEVCNKRGISSEEVSWYTDLTTYLVEYILSFCFTLLEICSKKLI